MNITSYKILYILAFLGFFSLISHGQQGNITVNQNYEISNLLKVKKEMSDDIESGNRYKINIFSGSRSNAKNTQNGYNNLFTQWPSDLVYETPNYKVYVGNFRTRLNADRALMKIKKKFTNAFIFKP